MVGGAETARKNRLVHRSASRLGAVQALYQMELAETEVGEVLAQFSTRTSGENFDGGECGSADFEFFQEIVRGVVREQRTIDPQIADCLAPGWNLARLDSILRAILRAGAYELVFREDVPAKVVISEYLNVAHAFFEREEPSFVNGVLDKLARSLATSRL
jgi:N utilization substance protein B